MNLQRACIRRLFVLAFHGNALQFVGSTSLALAPHAQASSAESAAESGFAPFRPGADK
jgi:hypothetical protein